MEQNIIYKKALNNGLTFGGIFVAYNILLFMFETNSYGMFGLVDILISLLMFTIYFQMSGKKFRDVDNGGFITYRRIFAYFLLTGVITAFVYSVFRFLLFEFGDVTFMKEQAFTLINSLESKGLPQETVDSYSEKILASLELTPIQHALGSFINTIIGTLIVGLIVAAFIKKRKPMFEN